MRIRKSLPDDRLEQSAQHAALACGLGASAWAVTLVLAGMFAPIAAASVFPWPGALIGMGLVIALAASGLMLSRRRRLPASRDVGSYELVDKLAYGGMGEVWRAEHRMLVRPVAVKLVRSEKLRGGQGDPAGLHRRFEREAQAISVLNSPHTIELYDYGQTPDGLFYYAMELLNGRDLESLVREHGPLPATRAVYLLRQICHSLAEAHARGLVHRDVKPANVFVSRMGLDYDFVKVLDFGLVKFTAGRGGNPLMTSDLVTSGTPAYMAPDIVTGDVPIDPRVDVYSIGCLAYWLLTGQTVFEAETPMKMLLAHLEAVPVPPSRRTELPIPRELEDLVLACLEKDPAHRPQHAGVVLQRLDEIDLDDSWTQDSARRWWERNLPDFTQPLVLAVPAARPVATTS